MNTKIADIPTTPLNPAVLRTTKQKIAGPVPARIFGNFLEHLGFSIDGGVLAQALANPTFERDVRLSEQQAAWLLETGKLLVQFYENHQDPGVFPENWSPGSSATGFGVSALEDYRHLGIPFPWVPFGKEGLASASVGRLGGAVRVKGVSETQPARPGEAFSTREGPAGLRQGLFLPFQRCLGYSGDAWVRIASSESSVMGMICIGLRRRLRGNLPEQPAGECLAAAQVELKGSGWQKLNFTLRLFPGQVAQGEPVDFFLQWLPQGAHDLLIDRVILNPTDAIDGIFDPDVLRMVKEWRVPLLRWPGGNFVSHYHWRDAVGPVDRRPTRPNYAWGGFETNFFGTSEFIHFCRLVGAEPHIAVNTGTGTAEEAAAWVEYCNGDAATPMGALRAAHDRTEPYNVKLWEVGNETYGTWQGGYYGGEENSLRYQEFSAAMRAVDPSLELMATGNQFDIAEPGPGLDHTNADRQWNRAVIKANAGKIDYLSLHSLPSNDTFLETLTDEEAYYSLLAQPDAWERIFIPDILKIDAEARAKNPGAEGTPLRIAITEWGVLGPLANRRPAVENYGEVVYAGIFLNMVMRNCDFIPVCNTTALLHGGCIRKAGGQVFADPQYLVLQKYTSLAGAEIIRCLVESPAYDVQSPPDLGLALEGVPYLDAACCSLPGGKIVLCLVNRHLKQPLPLRILPDSTIQESSINWAYLTYPDITARARPGDPGRFAIASGQPTFTASEIGLSLPPASVSWVSFFRKEQG